MVCTLSVCFCTVLLISLTVPCTLITLTSAVTAATTATTPVQKPGLLRKLMTYLSVIRLIGVNFDAPVLLNIPGQVVDNPHRVLGMDHVFASVRLDNARVIHYSPIPRSFSIRDIAG